ncbi:MAG: ATP-binding cassette domain-containing protein [Leptolyngbya sp. SIOISBB]|nr:ATP-binding cassette domain-containing protein [Leptolyngbya sp. SIOISBB]
MAIEPTIVANQLNHYYGTGRLRRQILFDIDFEIQLGEIVIMTGPSGSGKTTLLTLVGGLRDVQEGSLQVLGQELRGVSSGRLGKIRRQIGFIFQDHNLLSSLNAIKNVEMAAALYPISGRESMARSQAALESVGLGQHLTKRPDQLSGGQKQRVAIARALVNEPQVILADEPTASLDGHTGREVVELMQQLAKQQGCTIILVTHDNRILDIADRIISLEDGHLSSSKGEFLLGLSNLTSFIVDTEVDAIHDLIEPLSEAQFSNFLNKLDQELEQVSSSMNLLRDSSFNSKLEITLQAISLKIAQSLQAEQVTFFVVDRDREILWSKNARGTEGQLISIEIPITAGIAGYVATTGETVNIPDPYNDERFNPQIDRDTGFLTRNILCLPMMNENNEVFAVVQALNKSGNLPFDEADEASFFELAGFLGFTVQSSIEHTQQIYASMHPQNSQPSQDEIRAKTGTLKRENIGMLRAKVMALSTDQFIGLLNQANSELQELTNSGAISENPERKEKSEKLFQILSHKVSQTVEAESTHLLLVSHTTKTLYTDDVLARTQGRFRMIEVPLNTGIPGGVASTGQPVIINQLVQDQHFDTPYDQELNSNARNLLVVPVSDPATSEIVAVIQVFNKLNGSEFRPEDVNDINVFVDELGESFQTSVRLLLTSFS